MRDFNAYHHVLGTNSNNNNGEKAIDTVEDFGYG